ncbi:MAG: DNA polymerase IV [Methylobacteriaceae bacterium]|jgi:DNA polymerase-4|nr:DNA polymerase IV [Methylobacteriaceae bacterium]
MGNGVPHLCRDCLALTTGVDIRRCPRCGSPRLAADAELEQLAVAHVDCDAFFASVEKRDNPELADKPVIVGGLGGRGVVSTACYIARAYGVRSAMPMFQARKLCPQATIVPPDHRKYQAVSTRLHAMMLALTPLVEMVSIDEAFIDLSGTEKLHRASPAVSLAELALKVEKELGITISIGLSHNRFLAKIASDLEKPRGFSIISRGKTLEFLADKPVSILPGVGAVTSSRLIGAGLLTLKDVREADQMLLLRLVGSDSERLRQMAWGRDSRPVSPERETKSVSTETTLEKDISSFEELEPLLWMLCEKVAHRLKAGGFACRSVTLKLKDSKFQLRTRTLSFSAPTRLAARLFEIARPQLQKECTGTAWRLIGVGAGDLCPESAAETRDLSDPDLEKKVKVEEAVDRLRDKFGKSVIKKGIVLR